MNSKFLLGVGISVAIIIVIAILLEDYTTSLTELEIRQSIEYEISKTPQITGIHAQNICDIIDLECTSQTSFNAAFDPSDGYTKFSYWQNGIQYNFRIMDDILEYKSSKNPTEWRTLEDAFMDNFGWNDSSLQNKEGVIKDNTLNEQKYSRIFHFDSDPLGNYEKWCSAYNGIYYPSEDNSKIKCELTTEKDHDDAREGLREFKKQKISGELAQKLCRAYGKECQPGIFITMEYDMETGELYKMKRLDNPSPDHYYTEYRIIDDVIQYRIPTSPPQPWITFEE